MPDTAVLLALVAGSYALGCIVGAYYLVRWRTGSDLRDVGSGNAGARNAARILGRAGFAGALAIDMGKGAVATWMSLRLGLQPVAVSVAMVAVVAGHIWPAQLGFRGGKGAATSLGVMLVFDSTVALLALAVGILALALTRRFTLSGLGAIALGPLIAAWRGHGAVSVAGLATIAVIVLYAHRSNLFARQSVGDDPHIRPRQAQVP